MSYNGLSVKHSAGEAQDCLLTVTADDEVDRSIEAMLAIAEARDSVSRPGPQEDHPVFLISQSTLRITQRPPHLTMCR